MTATDASRFDLVIRGGTVIDGTGAPARRADVAVADGVIVAVGEGLAGREEIDAEGLIVTPGFVDIHTHYDGHATWETRMQPSSWHGVTTVVMSNCGVGFAPCRPQDREELVRLMEGVEDIPHAILAEGLPWNWESFPDFMDALAAREYDVDIGVQLPHAPLRVYVMGKRGIDREPAVAADIARMRELACEAIEAGALGFSTSRTIAHRASDGHLTPSLGAAEAELTGIALGLADAGGGVLQLAGDFAGAEGELFEIETAMLRRIMARSGRPLSFSLTEYGGNQAWRRCLDMLSAANAEGLEMRAQVAPRPVGLLLGLDLTMNPFSFHPAFAEIADLDRAGRAARLRDPVFRARLLAGKSDPQGLVAKIGLAAWDKLYPIDDVPDYEPTADGSIAAIAARQGRSPEDVALDHLLREDGRGVLLCALTNYGAGSLDPVYDMLRHPDTVPGLSDGGAHMGMICDGSFPTTMLVHWTRDRTRGPRIALEDAVKMQSWDTATAVGLHDRGQIRPGLRADINLIDYPALRLHPPELRYDLPSGGKRLVQRASGYVATLVAGVVTYRDGEPTGALPGRLVRGARSGAGAGTMEAAA